MTYRISLFILILLLIGSEGFAATPLQLTDEERAWLSEHPRIRIGVDPDWPPFEFIDSEQQYRGMGAETIALVAGRLGIHFEVAQGLSWNAVLEEARAARIDLLPTITPSPQRKEYLLFSHPHLDFPMVIVTRSNAPFVGSLDELHGQRIAVVDQYVSHDLLERHHSHLKLHPKATIRDALKSLSTGSVDAFVGNLASVSYAVNQLGLTNLKVAAHTPYSFKLAMAAPKDRAPLISAIDKALASLSDEELQSVRQHWVLLRDGDSMDLRGIALVVGPLLAAILLIALITLLVNRRLRREVRQRRTAEAALRRSQEALTESQRTAHIGWWQWDLDSEAIDWSEEIYAISGRSPRGFQPTVNNFLEVVHPQDRRAFYRLLERTLSGEPDVFETHFRVVRPDGSERHVNCYGKISTDVDEGTRHYTGVIHDVTEQTIQHHLLQTKNRTLQSILDNAPIGIWLQKPDGRMAFVNKAFCNAVGISESQFLAVPHYRELLPEEVAEHCVVSDEEATHQDRPHISSETLQFVDGKPHDLEIIKVRIDDEQGTTQGILGLSLDVTDKKAAEAKLHHQAYYDPLTGLPNRPYLMQQLAKSLAQARRHAHYSALLFFDLDNFKSINDTLGHHTGDQLLAEVGRRLGEAVREEDTPARLGGDEFVVILANLGSEVDHAAESARGIAEKIQRVISAPLRLAERDHHVTLSIGVALFPMEDEDAHDILKRADTAMYRAKEGGRNTIRFFLPSMQKSAEDRYQLQQHIRQGLHNDEFDLYYQPQFDHQGRLIGAESLVRWHQADDTIISPARFIPIAEESGLIIDLGVWVLRKACMQLRQWMESGFHMPMLAVNISPRQVEQPDFVRLVEAILKETGVDPSRLEFEFTENVFIQSLRDVASKMRALRKLGIRFAIDDFGTGYSSLNYLKHLPLDRLKIDRSFINDAMLDESSARIVETIIAMAMHLELEVLAEGVERREELAFLRENGCHLYQGYYFSKPLRALEMERHMETRAMDNA